MRKFTVFVLSSVGALTLLAGTAVAGAAGLWMYSARHAEHDVESARRVAWMEKHVGETPGCFATECPTTEAGGVPVPMPTEPVAPVAPADGAAPMLEAPAPDVAPAPLDRDEEMLALKAQLAAALQRIAELEAQQADKAPATKPGGDF